MSDRGQCRFNVPRWSSQFSRGEFIEIAIRKTSRHDAMVGSRCFKNFSEQNSFGCVSADMSIADAFQVAIWGADNPDSTNNEVLGPKFVGKSCERLGQIGRASCREREWVWVVAGS